MPRLPRRPRAAITGAGSGFGRALALVLAKRGARLVVSDIDEDGLEQTLRQVRMAGAEARSIPCDVRNPEEVEAMAALADEAFDGVDLVVNNAGVAVAGPVGEVSLEDWRWQLDINLFGVIHGCHAFVPRLKKQGSGFVLNVASSAGLLNAPLMAPYNVSKAGVISLSETLYTECRSRGVHVSALCPTFFKTRIHESLRGTDPELKQAATRMVTTSSWTAERIAEIALRDMQRGKVIIVPQTDGRLMWRLKRSLPQRFPQLVSKLFGGRAGRRVVEKMA
jgi:NAD(P)-dependent dehydrogenase (short-subunit alcohol dehydrogenase family)